MAREVSHAPGGKMHSVDLESDVDLRLLSDPEPILRTVRGLVVIDEVRRVARRRDARRRKPGSPDRIPRA